MAAFLTIPLLIYPEPLIHGFLSKEIPSAHTELLVQLIKITLVWIWLYFIFDGLVWIFAGILTAAGDTLFVMLINAVNVWLFSILPVYIFVVWLNGAPDLTWQITTCYGLANVIMFYLRYRSNRWKEKLVV